jgi:hypothetical protein|tara:strand:+ start:433 stop:654 length:222 start_codon:yes stop_codon:yes gene_type:complete
MGGIATTVKTNLEDRRSGALGEGEIANSPQFESDLLYSSEPIALFLYSCTVFLFYALMIFEVFQGVAMIKQGN